VRLLFYELFKKLVAVCFNLLNFLLLGNLPPLGSVCVVVEDQGKYLLIRRPGGKYVFPGGFMRWREHPVQSAKRECLEETGLRITIQGLIGCSANPSNRLTKMSSLTVIYRASVIDGELLRSTIEGQACWIDSTELPSCLHHLQSGIYDHYLRYQEQNASS
jgi:8-oxo-dGTP diphosphatase